MISRLTRVITGLVGAVVFGTFVLGLSHSISTGFAGFWGGFPFAVIAVVVLLMALYDYWDECIRNSED